MIVKFETSLAPRTPGERLDIRKDGNRWKLWDKENDLGMVKVDDKDFGLDHYKVIVGDDGMSGSVVRFADLHRHSDCSLMDGTTQIPVMVEKTEYAGALTDHGNMYGFLEYYKAMKAADKHPIIGMEAYQENLLGKLSRHHLILLAKNDQGYKNMLKLTSESFHHFYHKPHVTWQMLEQYHEGIICTSACLGGLIPSSLMKGNESDAVAALKRFKEIFGDDFYLEIQRHGIKGEAEVNSKILALGKEYGVPVVATTDAHYPNKDDSYAHEVVWCIREKKPITGPHHSFEGTGYHLRSSAEMEQLFADIPEVLDNTLRLAEKCIVNVPLGDVNLPNYKIPSRFASPMDYFRYLCEEGFKNRFAGKPQLTDPKYKERFDYEMNMIEKMGFESYFIIVWDFIDWARKHDIYIGPGRGSAAGSLLAFCMGITDMDPIRFNLLFERFLNPERVSWPDIDTDIEHVGRPKVIDYMTKKYGEESVCRIVTFGTFAAKQSIKDVARALGYGPGWANNIAKMVPNEPKMTLTKALDSNPELKTRYENDPDVAKVIDIARKIEGNKRHASQHACGLIISPGEVSNYLPTSLETDDNGGEKTMTAQVTMSEVEELSLIKMDLLGLKNLTAIHEVINTIKKTRGIDMVYQDIPLDDRDTYVMLSKGMTGGVFQLEGEGMTRNVIMPMLMDAESLPESRMNELFERLIAAVALYRPGPMDYIPNYIAGMRDFHKITYLTPELEELLKPTYGVLVYQEQVMQVTQKLAGYTMGRADVVRKGCAKKKTKILAAEKEVFIHGNKAAFESGKEKNYAPGCVANGIAEPIAQEIWAQMEKFGSYAFNRSHAACYAWIACITAYMACHWGPEFFCAMMNAFEDTSDKVKSYMSMADKRGIKILPPDINKSEDHCTVDGGCIRLGFRTLAYLNKFSKKIIKEREAQGPFADFQDFYERMTDHDEKPNKNALESLIYSGALDCFGLNRNQLVTMLPMLERDYKKTLIDRTLGQLSIFTPEEMRVPTPDVPEFGDRYLMEKERAAIGFYLTNHPVDALYALGDNGCIPITDILATGDDLNGEELRVSTYAIIKDIKQIFTKHDDEMYLFAAEDRFSGLSCVMFPKRVAANKHRLEEGALVKLSGYFSVDDQRGPQLIVQDILSAEDVQNRENPTVVVTIQTKEQQESLIKFVAENPGKTKVQLHAKGRLFSLKDQIDLTPAVISFLKENFPKVST